MPLQATSGAASYDAFGGGVPVVPNYIEEVFSTFLYTGNGSTQTITNGIDLAGKGGLVWFKSRSTTNSHRIFDTARGVQKFLNSSDTGAQTTNASTLTAFNTTGFDIGSSSVINTSSELMASWTFRKQPKFFDVVTYTGDGTSPRSISHSLGSAPGCVIIKQTNAVNDWCVWHTSTGTNKSAALNTTAAFATFAERIKSVTSTTFSVGNSSTVNDSGATYVAYLFAHNAGGFGLTGTDNVISCGSFTASGGAATVTLGYEPQWLLFKRSDSSIAGDWRIIDNMRNWNFSRTAELILNTSAAEDPNAWASNPTATGFTFGSGTLTDSGTYIYIAIRRGPMKVPTSGTSVFAPVAQAGNGGNDTITTGFTTDLVIGGSRTANPIQGFVDRLRGFSKALLPNNTSAEDTSPSGRDLTSFASNTGFTLGYPPFATSYNYTGNNIYWNFRRAPSFFDEVCYTGTGSTRTVTHNLGVAPELVIVKIRSSSGDNWFVLSTSGTARLLRLNSSAEDSGGVETVFGNGSVYIAPTSTNFTVGGFGAVNQLGSTFVAYLFATCAGVSKVGAYTGNGSTQTINCGFTGGARFVMVKATSTTGNWIVADSARGIVAGNDPALYLNSTAAEVTGLDWIDADNSGFVVNETATIAANTNGVSYIFLAIA